MTKALDIVEKALDMANTIQTSWTRISMSEHRDDRTVNVVVECHFCESFEDYTMSSQGYYADEEGSREQVINDVDHQEKCVVYKANEYVDAAMAELMADPEPEERFETGLARKRSEEAHQAAADREALRDSVFGDCLTPSRSRKQAIQKMTSMWTMESNPYTEEARFDALQKVPISTIAQVATKWENDKAQWDIDNDSQSPVLVAKAICDAMDNEYDFKDMQ